MGKINRNKNLNEKDLMSKKDEFKRPSPTFQFGLKYLLLRFRWVSEEFSLFLLSVKSFRYFPILLNYWPENILLAWWPHALCLIIKLKWVKTVKPDLSNLVYYVGLGEFGVFLRNFQFFLILPWVFGSFP